MLIVAGLVGYNIALIPALESPKHVSYRLL
jgi:hypothetical protein